jgi:hypothetical protein
MVLRICKQETSSSAFLIRSITVILLGIFTADRKDDAGNKHGTKLLPELISLDLGYARQVGQLVSKTQDLADLPGVPMTAYYYLPNLKCESILNSRILDRKFAFHDAALNPPAGCKKVALDKNLFMTTSQVEIFNDIYETGAKLK